jgi:hypothetical protein
MKKGKGHSIGGRRNWKVLVKPPDCSTDGHWSDLFGAQDRYFILDQHALLLSWRRPTDNHFVS